MSTKRHRTHIKRLSSGVPAIAYSASTNSAIIFGKGGNQATSSSASAPSEFVPAKASIAESMGANQNHWVLWGCTDSFPQHVALLMRKSPVGRAGLRRLTKNIYGQRLFLYKIKGFDAQGEPQIETVTIPEWDDIVRRSNFNAVRVGMYQDYAYYDINFPEIIFNGNKTKVWSVNYQKSSHCRMALRDKDTGRIPWIYCSGNFPQVQIEQCDKYPAIDFMCYPDQIDEIRKDYTHFNYIMPQFWPDVLNDYYPEVFWYSSKDQIELANLLPALKKNSAINQMAIKYQFEIPLEYFEEMYDNWKGMSVDEQDAIIDDLHEELVKNLTGVENPNKAIMTFYRAGKDGKPSQTWNIKAIDDKMKTEAWLPDEAAAGQQIQFSMMLNPALSGQGNTGGNFTGGANNGGSNIRESGLDARAMTQADRDIVHSFFNFIRDYNGWDPEVQLGVQDMVLTTLDTGAGTKKTLS